MDEDLIATRFEFLLSACRALAEWHPDEKIRQCAVHATGQLARGALPQLIDALARHGLEAQLCWDEPTERERE